MWVVDVHVAEDADEDANLTGRKSPKIWTPYLFSHLYQNIMISQATDRVEKKNIICANRTFDWLRVAHEGPSAKAVDLCPCWKTEKESEWEEHSDRILFVTAAVCSRCWT